MWVAFANGNKGSVMNGVNKSRFNYFFIVILAFGMSLNVYKINAFELEVAEGMEGAAAREATETLAAEGEAAMGGMGEEGFGFESESYSSPGGEEVSFGGETEAEYDPNAQPEGGIPKEEGVMQPDNQAPQSGEEASSPRTDDPGGRSDEGASQEQGGQSREFEPNRNPDEGPSVKDDPSGTKPNKPKSQENPADQINTAAKDTETITDKQADATGASEEKGARNEGDQEEKDSKKYAEKVEDLSNVRDRLQDLEGPNGEIQKADEMYEGSNTKRQQAKEKFDSLKSEGVTGSEFDAAASELKQATEEFENALKVKENLAEEFQNLKNAKAELKEYTKHNSSTKKSKAALKGVKEKISAAEGKKAYTTEKVAKLKEELGIGKSVDEALENEFKTTNREELSSEKQKSFDSRKAEFEESMPQENETVEEYKQRLEEKGTPADEIREKVNKFEELKSQMKELESIESELNSLERQKKFFEWETNKLVRVGRTLKSFGNFFKDQFSMALAFSIPGEIMRGVQEAMNKKELYKNITDQQKFGGIKMQIVPGFVTEASPESGLFIYYDVQDGDANLTAPQRRFFVSWSDRGSEYYAKEYLGSGSVSKMMELKTGAIFDGSGQMDDFSPLMTQEIVSPRSSFDKKISIQEYLNTEKRAAAGDVKKTHYGALFSDPGKHTDSPPGNKDVVALMEPNVTTKISSMIQPSLTAFTNGVTMNAFGGVTLQEMQGIGSLRFVLANYIDLFETGGSKKELGKKIKDALAQGKDLTVRKSNPIFVDGEETLNEGLEAGKKLIAQKVYVYQSDDTPLAKFIRKIVPKQLQPFVHDYLVAVSITGEILPAQVPKINSNESGSTTLPVVQWVENPNVAYLVSVVTGTTFVPSKESQVLTNVDGSPDFDVIANPVVQTFFKQYGSDKGATLISQVAAMKFLAENLINKGPFKLRDGINAIQLLDLDEQLANVDEATLRTIKGEQEAGESLQGGGVKDAGMSLQDKKNLLKEGGGIYIYKIDNALPGPDKTMLPDYIVPVAFNESNGLPLIVSLGSQAAVSSGVASAHVSTEVSALISLVTSKLYTRNYTPFSKEFTTPVYKTTSPGNRVKCTSGADCQDGYLLQPSAQKIPTATAFMETDLNPANKDRAEGARLTMVPLYFTGLQFDVCNGGIASSAGKTLQDSSAFFKAKFMDVVACDKPRTLSVPLYKILPQTFTGIPWESKIQEYLSAHPSLQKSDLGVLKDKHSLAQVHALWKGALLTDPKNKWSLIEAEGPHNFTNNGVNDWSVAAQPSYISHGVFMYTVHAPGHSKLLKSMWIAAQLNGTNGSIDTGAGAKGIAYKTGSQFNDVGIRFNLEKDGDVYGVAQATEILTMKNFTNVGADFSSNKKGLNALINVGTGAVLLRFKKGDAKSGTPMDIVAPITNSRGGLYSINPSEITKALTVTVGGSLSAEVELALEKEQEGRTGDVYGPFVFGPFVMLINREQVNNGNYIYQAYSGSLQKPQVYDYLVGVTTSGGSGTVTQWGQPLDATGKANAFVSLVSAKEYTRVGQDSYTKWVGKNPVLSDGFYPGQSKGQALLGFGNSILTLISTGCATCTFPASGIPVNQSIADAIHAHNADYVEKSVAQKGQKEGTADLSYMERVLDKLAKNADMLPQLKSLTKVSGATNLYVNTMTKKHYLKAFTNLNDSTASYYEFNVAKPGDDTISIVPTGINFQVDKAGKVTAVNGLYGSAAKAMASAHGISISEDGTSETRTFAVERSALTMMKSDKNLVGGKDGTIMKLVRKAGTSPDGSNYYLYANIADFNAVQWLTPEQQQTGTAASNKIIDKKRPADYLLQINRKGKDAYYVSLVTGNEYDIQGQPARSKATVFLPEDKDGKLIGFAPMTVWGDAYGDLKILVPNEFSTGEPSAIRFVEVEPINSGIVYQYAGKEGVFNYTYINPSTQKVDNGVYKVDTKNLNVAVQNWQIDTAKAQPDENGLPTVSAEAQASQNMSNALKAAREGGLVPSQRIYKMATTGKGSVGYVFMEARFNLSTGKWSLYSASATSETGVNWDSLTPLGVFKPAINADGSNKIEAEVFTLLGKRAQDDGTGGIATIDDSVDAIDSNRVIQFRNNIPGSKTIGQITGVAWSGRYFALDKVMHNKFTNGGLSISTVENISPALHCTGPQDKMSEEAKKVCTKWTSKIDSNQFPNDVQYLSVLDVIGQNVVQYVYSPDFPVVSNIDLDTFYKLFKMQPIFSRSGKLTMVSNIDVATLKPLTTAFVHGEKETYEVYKQKVLDEITAFYDDKIAHVEETSDATIKNADARNRAQIANFGSSKDVDTGQVQINSDGAKPWCRPGTTCPASAEPTLKQQLGADQYKLQKEVGASSASLQLLYRQQKEAALKELNARFAHIESNIGLLYSDEKGNVLFKKEAVTGKNVSYEFVSYETLSREAGFVFNTQGIPTGKIATSSQLESIKDSVGALQVISEEPLKLEVPGVGPASK